MVEEVPRLDAAEPPSGLSQSRFDVFLCSPSRGPSPRISVRSLTPFSCAVKPAETSAGRPWNNLAQRLGLMLTFADAVGRPGPGLLVRVARPKICGELLVGAR